MLEGIDTDRLLAMTDREKRWFDNIKKAFSHSDEALQAGSAEDECLAELFKAIDTAKTLRRSLRGEDASHHQNKQRFIEFLGLEIPMARPGESEWELTPKSGGTKKYHFGEIVYDIRVQSLCCACLAGFSSSRTRSRNGSWGDKWAV